MRLICHSICCRNMCWLGSSGCVLRPKKMREHLYNCFQKKVLRPFPQEKSLPHRKMALRSRNQVMWCELFCECKMPDIYDTEMVQCDWCNEWIHCSCASFTDIGQVPKNTWKCSRCCEFLSKAEVCAMTQFVFFSAYELRFYPVRMRKSNRFCSCHCRCQHEIARSRILGEFASAN